MITERIFAISTMNNIIQKAIRNNETMRKTSLPWTVDEPHAQSFYEFDSAKQSWQPRTPEINREKRSGVSGLSRLALHSWNIDFMLPFAEARMDAALAHLEDVTNKIPPTTAVIIYLQECIVPDLSTIGRQPWIRDKFYITDINSSNWASGHYGTTTLIDRRLSIASCFRVHYSKTRMERDALFTDVLMGNNQDKTIRFCNTHLESLVFEPPFRPLQVRVAAKYMHQGDVHGAVTAGDFNAIQPFDKTLHSDNNLKDAYLELGGQEDSDAGYTWGQQAATDLREQFGCSRMDKVYFCGGLRLRSFERFGADVQLEEESQKNNLVELGFDKPWITDHLGVISEFDVVD